MLQMFYWFIWARSPSSSGRPLKRTWKSAAVCWEAKPENNISWWMRTFLSWKMKIREQSSAKDSNVCQRSPPGQTAGLLRLGSSAEPPWEANTKRRLGCSAGQTHETKFTNEHLYTREKENDKMSRWYLDDALVRLEDGVGVHLGALFLHQHDLCAFCR